MFLSFWKGTKGLFEHGSLHTWDASYQGLAEPALEERGLISPAPAAESIKEA